MSDPIQAFYQERVRDIEAMARDVSLKQKSLEWMLAASRYKYSYNYTWMGRPIIKYPNDILVLQELLWQVKPDFVIETGIAHGGSLIFFASILELIGQGEVLGVDIEIREHNRREILDHSMARRISLFEGSSTDPELFERIRQRVEGSKVLVCLDSMHTHAHVLAELKRYAPLVSPGSYLICSDTHVESYPPGFYADRPWDVGNNPMTALQAFLGQNPHFVPDDLIHAKLMISESPGGYLRRMA